MNLVIVIFAIVVVITMTCGTVLLIWAIARSQTRKPFHGSRTPPIWNNTPGMNSTDSGSLLGSIPGTDSLPQPDNSGSTQDATPSGTHHSSVHHSSTHHATDHSAAHGSHHSGGFDGSHHGGGFHSSTNSPSDGGHFGGFDGGGHSGGFDGGSSGHH